MSLRGVSEEDHHKILLNSNERRNLDTAHFGVEVSDKKLLFLQNSEFKNSD